MKNKCDACDFSNSVRSVIDNICMECETKKEHQKYFGVNFERYQRVVELLTKIQCPKESFQVEELEELKKLFIEISSEIDSVIKVAKLRRGA